MFGLVDVSLLLGDLVNSLGDEVIILLIGFDSPGSVGRRLTGTSDKGRPGLGVPGVQPWSDGDDG